MARSSIAYTYGDGNPYADCASRDLLEKLSELARQQGLSLSEVAIPIAARGFLLRLRDAYRGSAFSGCSAGDGPRSLSPPPSRVRARCVPSFPGGTESDVSLVALVRSRSRSSSPKWCTRRSRSPVVLVRSARSPTGERRSALFDPVQLTSRPPLRSSACVWDVRLAASGEPVLACSESATPSAPRSLSGSAASALLRRFGPPSAGTGPLSLFDALRGDKSSYAIRPTDPEVLAALCRGVKFYSERGSAPSSRKRDIGAPWGRWERRCRSHNTPAWRCDVAANTGVDILGKTRKCALRATFPMAAALKVRPRGRHDRAAKPESIMVNLYAVRRLHDAEGFKMASLATAVEVILG